MLDDLYNSVSKSSSNFIPEVEEKNAEFKGTEVTHERSREPRNEQALQIEKLYEEAPAPTPSVSDDQAVKVSGNVGGDAADAILADSQTMYDNNGAGRWSRSTAYRSFGRRAGQQTMNDWDTSLSARRRT